MPYLKLVRAVWQNALPWRKSIVGYYLAYILAQSFLSIGPYAFGRTIDVLQHFRPDRLKDVLFWLLFFASVNLIFWLFHGPARVLERNVAMKIKQSFAERLYQQLTLLPLKWHQEHHSGDTIARINRACTALNKFAENQFIYVETLVRFLIALGFLFWISIPVGFLSLATCILATLVILHYDRKLLRLYEQENEAENYISAGFFDYISNMTTILTLRLGKMTESNLYKRLQAIWPAFKPEVRLNELKWFLMNNIVIVLQALILLGYIIIKLKTMDLILIGTVVIIFQYQWDLSEVFFVLSLHYSELVQMDTQVESVQPILNDLKNYAHPIPGEKIAEAWQIFQIDDLSYQHPDTLGNNGISDLSLCISRGEKIALIGESGAGKSTLLNLLSGLYLPDSVRLSIDAHQFHSLEPLHAITTLIPQEPEIFENTIGFNISMGLEPTAEDLAEVIELSGFAPVLAKLKQGLATDIREKGLNLSVGQKQRLALARGLLAAKYSSFILMDEPTSSVDLATEKQILTTVINAFPTATLMVSLHRLHLLPQFTRVILLREGQIIADGPTELLLNSDNPVRLLWDKYHK